MARNLKTQDVARITRITRFRVEEWRRRGFVTVPQARPLVWGNEEIFTAACIGALADAGAPLESVRGLQDLIRNKGSPEALRGAWLVVVLPTKADVETAAARGIPYEPVRLVNGAAALAKLAKSATQTLAVVDVGQILDALERTRAELLGEGEREGQVA